MKKLASIMLLSLAVAVFAQQPLAVKAIALTDAEHIEATAAKSAVEQAQAALNQALNALAGADLSDCGRATYAGMSVQLRLREKQIAEGQEREALLRQKAAHNCPTCAWSDDRRALVKQ